MATVVFPEIATANNAITTLNGAINNSTTTVVLATGGAAALGLSGSTTDAYITVIDATTWRKNPLTSPEVLEIMQVTAVSTDTLTVTRGVDGTSATAFADASIVELRITAAMIQRVYDALTDGTDTIAPAVCATAAGTAAAPAQSFSGDVDTGLYNISADTLGVSCGGTLRGTFSSGGNLTMTANFFGGRSYLGDGSVAAPSISFSSDGNSGFYRIGTDNVGVSTGGTKALDIGATQRVQISNGFLSLGTPTELTIATGAVTATRSYHTIDTESDGLTTDDLDTISGGADGDILVIRAANAARDVVVKDGTGNIQCAGDFTMNNTQDTMTLIYDATLTAWIELSRSDNGA